MSAATGVKRLTDVEMHDRFDAVFAGAKDYGELLARFLDEAKKVGVSRPACDRARMIYWIGCRFHNAARDIELREERATAERIEAVRRGALVTRGTT